jgi:hypothetical protein
MSVSSEFWERDSLVASCAWPPPRYVLWRQRAFPGEECQLGMLRRWLAAELPECPARADVTCVATELGSNAIRHTASGQCGLFVAGFTWLGAAVRVAVADGGAPSGPRVAKDKEGEQGRGLLVVRGLSARVGVCGGLQGRLVWADVPWVGPWTAESALVPMQQRRRLPVLDPVPQGLMACGVVPCFLVAAGFCDRGRASLGARSTARATSDRVGRAGSSKRVLAAGSPSGDTGCGADPGPGPGHGSGGVEGVVAEAGQDAAGLRMILGCRYGHQAESPRANHPPRPRRQDATAPRPPAGLPGKPVIMPSSATPGRAQKAAPPTAVTSSRTGSVRLRLCRLGAAIGQDNEFLAAGLRPGRHDRA